MASPQTSLASEALTQRLIETHKLLDWLCSETRLPLREPLANLIGRLRLPTLEGPVRCPTIYDFDLQVRRGNGENYYYKGFYEQGTLHVMRHCLRAGDTFVDGGASVGLMSLFAAKCVQATGRVLSFEPHPQRHTDLLAGIAFGHFEQVQALKWGLGDEPATFPLYTSVSPSLADQTGSIIAEVEVRRLDDVLADEGVSNVRMIKLDIEGFEGKALRGASHLLSGSLPPIVCFEHGAVATNDDPVEVLSGHHAAKYRYFQLTRTKSFSGHLKELLPKKLRKQDNVFAIPESQLTSVSPALWAKGVAPSGGI